MTKLLLILVVVSSVSFSSPLQIAAEVEQDVIVSSRGLAKLRSRLDRSLDSAINLAHHELKKRGYAWEAEELTREWHTIYQGSIYTRNIGDHKPISEWLRDKYEMIEVILGIDVCRNTHLSDIKTLNHGIPVVIDPCNFPMDKVTVSRKKEFNNHFHGDVYWGVLPVVTYWSAYSACLVGTVGTGYIVVCGLAGEASERLLGMVSSDLSDNFFDGVCK